MSKEALTRFHCNVCNTTQDSLNDDTPVGWMGWSLDGGNKDVHVCGRCVRVVIEKSMNDKKANDA